MRKCLGLLVVLGAFVAAAAESRDFREVIAVAKSRVQPAVLYLKCVSDDFKGGREQAREVAGSAFIINAEGEFLTNAHVVDKARSIRCLLSDGRHFDADCLGMDKDMDLALCRLRLPEGVKVPFAVFGPSGTMSEGDFVIALGAPWGLSRSLTFGTISCARRYLEEHSEYVLWLQTDASIGPGNSGGPLVNTLGEVVGINALGSMFWTANFGFAIPADEAQLVLAQLREHGRVNWSWCGLRFQPLRDFNKNMYSPATNGVLVAEVLQKSPAARAGLLSGDRIVRVNGEVFNGVTDEDLPALRRRLGSLSGEKGLSFEIVRGDAEQTIVVSPQAKGDVEGKEKVFARWDLTAKSINRFETPELHFHRTEGVYVFGMADPGNADTAGLRRGDIILKVNNAPVKTIEDLTAAWELAMKNEAASRKSMFNVLRNGQNRLVMLDFTRDYEQ